MGTLGAFLDPSRLQDAKKDREQLRFLETTLEIGRDLEIGWVMGRARGYCIRIIKRVINWQRDNALKLLRTYPKSTRNRKLFTICVKEDFILAALRFGYGGEKVVAKWSCLDHRARPNGFDISPIRIDGWRNRTVYQVHAPVLRQWKIVRCCIRFQ